MPAKTRLMAERTEERFCNQGYIAEIGCQLRMTIKNRGLAGRLTRV